MDSGKIRVDWVETRNLAGGSKVTFHMIAELKDGRWEFFEKESGEVRWFEAPATPELIAKAEKKLQTQNG